MNSDIADLAREIIDSNLYMVLGTSDATGNPWVSPVYFAPDGYQRFYWVSRPEREHSRNIEVRPDVTIAIFDSTQPIGTGNGVYVQAHAEMVEGDDRADGIEVFSQRSVSHGGDPWTLEQIESSAPVRLYCATARDMFALEPGTDNRVEVLL